MTMLERVFRKLGRRAEQPDAVVRVEHDDLNDTPHIRVEMLSNPLYLAGMRELVGSVSKRLGFDDLDCSKIALAVDEAMCNVIRHGYGRQTDRPIWISIWPVAGDDGKAKGMRVVVEDEADQVDPVSVCGRDLDDIKPGGLGVHIINEVMDEVCLEPRVSGVGMRLTMVKRAAGVGSDAGSCAVQGCAAVKSVESSRVG